MATLSLEIDITELVKAYTKGFEDGFILANQTDELDSELNLNNIDDPEC